MTEPELASGLSDVLRRAVERKDADLLASLYTEDAELAVVNRSAPPSSPFVLRGRGAIAEYYGDVCGRAMTHRIVSLVAGKDRAAFNEECEYPDGTRVVCAAMLELERGKIARQVNVEAWDE